MNRDIIRFYIEEYKKNFHQVHLEEIYKWEAIKQFQETFDLEAPDFYSNMNMALRKTKNLLGSGNYFPRKMLLKNIEVSPNEVREMFRYLFDEDKDILERVQNFKSDFKVLSTANFGDRNPDTYQDQRAVMVYLTLRFPERYFLYKYRMFQSFADKIEFHYKPRVGRIENIGQFHNLCELVRYELEKDQQLLTLHESRLNENCYRDVEHNVLTQDFIYAVATQLDNSVNISAKPDVEIELTESDISDFEVSGHEVSFKPSLVNHIQNNIENKHLGDLGEIWVLKHEIAQLKKLGKPKLAKKVRHVAKDKGDGLGYDILSYDLRGKKKYIEVKTTRGPMSATFYVTRNELEWSKQNPDNYYLYRVHGFDEKTNSGELTVLPGDMTQLCQVPVNYKVTLKKE